MSYPIPRLTAVALAAYQGRAPQNPGLIFDRLAPCPAFWASDERQRRESEKAYKKDGLEATRRAAEKADAALLLAWNARWAAAARAMHAEPLVLKTDWRFIPGLGRKGPLEVGFSFHRYGFPILPGSSVKGIARAYAELVAGKQKGDADFEMIFGRAPEEGEPEDVARSGLTVFFDAIPAKPPALELDIMNPHYPDYYQEGKAPTNWQSPVPVYFLTVAPGAEFCFAVGWQKEPDENGRRLQKLALDWLIAGLANLGAGAKTTAGYGYFDAPATWTSGNPTDTLREVIIGPPVPPLPPPQPVARFKSRGQVRYDIGRVFIADANDATLRASVDWKALGMDALAGKTPVEYEYEETPDGRRKAVKVTRIRGSLTSDSR